MIRRPKVGRLLLGNRLLGPVLASLLSWGLIAVLVAGLYQAGRKVVALIQDPQATVPAPGEDPASRLNEIAPAAGADDRRKEDPD